MYRSNSVYTGVLYILGTIFGILSVVVINNGLEGEFLPLLAINPFRFTLSGFFILAMGFSLAGMTLFLYPLFKKDNEVLAMGMVLFRGAFEGVWYLLSALIWITLGVLVSRISSSGIDNSSLTAFAEILHRSDSKLGDIGTIAFIIGASCLYTSFYRTKLIPRWLSVWGLIAALPYLGYYILHLFDMNTDFQFIVIPLAVQEMVMGLWLIIKGFKPEAVRQLVEGE